MKSRVLLALGLLAALAVIAGPADAFLITFDSLAPYAVIDGLDLGGVVITSAPGSTVVFADGASRVGWTSPHNAISNRNPSGFNDFLTTQPLYMTFAVPQSSVAFTGGDSGGDTDQFRATAYDSANNVLGVVTTDEFGGNPFSAIGAMVDQYTVQLNFLGIKTVKVESLINFGIGIDNIQFCEAPVPPTVMLLGSGLLGLVGWRRWRR